jgi:hypothetical protein
MGKDEPSFIEPNRCNCTALRKASRRMSQFYDSAQRTVLSRPRCRPFCENPGRCGDKEVRHS